MLIVSESRSYDVVPIKPNENERVVVFRRFNYRTTAWDYHSIVRSVEQKQLWGDILQKMQSLKWSVYTDTHGKVEKAPK